MTDNANVPDTEAPKDTEKGGTAAAGKTEAGAGKKEKAAKSEKEKRLERILTVALVIVVIIFVYQVFHRMQVVEEAKDPHSPNAELGRRQAMEADEKMFEARPVLAIPKESAVMHERSNLKTTAKSGANVGGKLAPAK
jgi:hypothetical protein